jgi:hypothetical protein
MAETIPRTVLQMTGGFAIWQISSRSAIWIIQAGRPASAIWPMAMRH